MCGIAGIMTVNGAPPEPAVLDAMKRALAHRGPDGEGSRVSGEVGLIHKRLAIIDLETGDQPLVGPGGVALIANGEIYNYVELRRSLDGASMATQSDCEPPLHLYLRHGAGFAEHLRGMYAIAVHDPRERRLVLARDPFGIKPLYYAETPKGFAFASEPRAIIRAGLLAARVRRESAVELLQLQFTTGCETVFEGIRRVLPGETIVVERGRVVERRRRAALPSGPPESWREAEALSRLDEALQDSVTMHQRSDVPYGMFLSGGIDSSAVLAMMARLNERPVRAFTVGFPGTAVADEREDARTVAASLGAEHVEIAFSEADFWRLLPKVAAAADDPAADYATLPTYRLAAEAGRDLKVILSGEGGDEMFAGYGRYRRALRPNWLGGRPMRGRGALDGFAVLRDAGGWRAGLERVEAEVATDGRSALQRVQAADCAAWLPNNLLTKLDRCLMAHGVEGRTPFLDPAVAAVAFRLPDRLKARHGMGKWLLRRWLAEHAPATRPFARKRGFTVPVGEWISARASSLGPLVAAQPGVAELCDPDAVRAVFRDAAGSAGIAAWRLLFYALWHAHHVGGGVCGGDALEMLAVGRSS